MLSRAVFGQRHPPCVQQAASPLPPQPCRALHRQHQTVRVLHRSRQPVTPHPCHGWGQGSHRDKIAGEGALFHRGVWKDKNRLFDRWKSYTNMHAMYIQLLVSILKYFM